MANVLSDYLIVVDIISMMNIGKLYGVSYEIGINVLHVMGAETRMFLES